MYNVITRFGGIIASYSTRTECRAFIKRHCVAGAKVTTKSHM